MNRKTLSALAVVLALSLSGCAESLDSVREAASKEVWTFSALSENQRLEVVEKIKQAPSKEAVESLVDEARAENDERTQAEQEQQETWDKEAEAAENAFAELKPHLDNKTWVAAAGDVKGAGEERFVRCELTFTSDGTVKEHSTPGETGCSLDLSSRPFEQWEFDKKTHQLVLLRDNGQSRMPFYVTVATDTVTLEQRGMAEHTITFTIKDA